MNLLHLKKNYTDMSHFTVMVIGDNPEEQLAPYQENNMGDCPKEYLEFNDLTERLKTDWESEDEETKQKCNNDFDQYASEYQGYTKQEDGRYGYWYNPNSKWDWYVLGGRWSGYFKMKPNANGIKGRPGLGTPPAEAGYADAALKSEIDFAAMMEESSKKAGEQWDLVRSIIEGCEPIQSWDHIREQMFPGDIDAARAFYRNQPAVKAISEWNSKNNHKLFGIDLEDFQATREDFCLDAARASYVPFALIKDGKWYEKGEMGWWGMATNEMSETKWTAQVAQMLNELPDDTLISVYDCHI